MDALIQAVTISAVIAIPRPRVRAMGTPVSPFVVYSNTDYAGRVIKLTVTFDASYVITGCIADRDPATRFKNIYFGLGNDGTPNTTAIAIRNIPPGTGTVIPVADLNAVGFFTILDILRSAQVTAG